MRFLTTPLRANRLRAALGQNRFAKDLHVLGVVSSTSELAASRAKERPSDSLTVFAEAQTRGRGRRGTEWSSPARAGLYVSVVVEGLSPPSEAAALSIAMGVVMAHALEGVGLRPKIKWPNDLLLGTKKVGGALIEFQNANDGRAFAVLGFGLNLNAPMEDLPTDSVFRATSAHVLKGETIDREQVAIRLLESLEGVLDDYRSGSIDAIFEAFESRNALIHTRIAAREVDRIIEGEVVAIQPREGLVLRQSDGSLVTLRAAHTHILRVQWKER